MANNPYVNKVQLADGTTLIDISDTTAAAADVAQGKYFYDASGAKVQGTATGGGGSGGVIIEDTTDTAGGVVRTITAVEISGTKQITANGTGIDVTSYEFVDVAVPSSVPNLQAKTNISPTTSSQTITADSGYDGLSSVQINAMPSGTAGTPTATKGTVSNHQVSVTPSVTNTTGYITGSTKTGTAVTVTASELASGNKEITNNGSNIDVVGYSTVSVAVPSSSGKNVQVENGTKRVANTAYTDVGYEITVAKTGTYNAYWAGWRSSTSGTNGAQLYVNGTESGSAVTSFDANWTNVQNGSRTSVSLTQGDKVTLRARSRNTSYYMYIFYLAIEEV